MGLYADFHAAVSGVTAPLVVRYGDALQLSGRDVVRERHQVPTSRGRVPVEVYRPPGQTGQTPVLVHLHGGAFIMRHPRMDDFWCRFVAAEAGVAVVNVDYRAAPWARFPVAHEQAHDAIAWVQHEGSALGLDGRRLGVGGFSAGGNLAASACLRAVREGSFTARHALLAVPSLDVSTADKPSTVANPMISPRLVELVRAAYFRDRSRRSDPVASPLLADTVEGFPPTMLLTAEWDSLRAEGDAFAGRLAAAGVAVEHDVVPGRDHYFLDGNHLPQARSLMERMAAAVGSHLR